MSVFGDALREAHRRHADQEILHRMATTCNTVVTAEVQPHRDEVVFTAGYTTRLAFSRVELAGFRPADAVAAVAQELRARWWATAVDVPPNVVLGTD